MYRIHTVYLDMDGVLVDFNAGWLGRFGLPASFLDSVSPMKWNPWEHLLVSEQAFWNKCSGHDFWAGLPWTEKGREILAVLEEFFTPRSIYLLTTARHDDHGSWSGKFAWIEKHLPGYADRVIMTTAGKHPVSKPGCLLVDDGDHNVHDFCHKGESRYLNGEAMTVPSINNRLYEHRSKCFPSHLRQWLSQCCTVVRGVHLATSQSEQGVLELTRYRQEREAGT